MLDQVSTADLSGHEVRYKTGEPRWIFVAVKRENVVGDISPDVLQVPKVS
jgi:hypothetical protein